MCDEVIGTSSMVTVELGHYIIFNGLLLGQPEGEVSLA